jgi:LacI family transcriptional regulator
MISQKDIAKKIGVSRELVCKVLSGRMGTTRVKPVLRKKIIRTAKALGYLPNRNALGLFSGKRGAIAIFINPWGTDGTEFFKTLVSGISEALRPTMYHTWLCLFDTSRRLEQRMDIRELRSRVDALIIGGVYHQKILPVLRKVEKAGIPVVTFFEVHVPTHLPNVTTDARLQGRLATEHLIARGCRRIAHFSVHTIRAKGYRDALRAAGLLYDASLVVDTGDYEMANGHRTTRELLDRNVTFDGIFAHSDHLAFGAMQELIQRGIRVPRDVKIIGVDDAPLCLAGPVALSTVTSECYALGREAVDMINRKLAGEKVESRQIRPRVIQREST